MSNDLAILLPHAVLVGGACVLLAGLRVAARGAVWGCFTLAVIASAGVCLGFVADRSAGEFAHLLRTDDLSVAFQGSVLAFTFAVTLMSLGSWNESKRASRFYAMLLLMVPAGMLVAAANDLIVMFLAAELMSLAAFFLTFLSRSPRLSTHESRAGIDWNQYFLLNVLASGVLLYGISFLYGLAGTTNFDAIGSVFRDSYAPPPPSVPVGSLSRLGTVAMLLIVAGFGFRMAIVPFHFGTAELYDELAPFTPPLLAVLPTAAGFVALVRLLPETLAGSEATQQLLLIVLALVTMTVGNCMAYAETRIPRKLVSLVTAQTGYLLIGLAAASSVVIEHAGGAAATQDGGLPDAIPAAYLFLIAHALAVTGVFAVLVYLSRTGRPLEYVSELSGLVRTEPAAAVCTTICLLSLAGLPPTPGFWGRLFLLFSALGVQVESSAGDLLLPHGGFVALALLAAINGVLTAIVCLRLIVVLLFDPQIARPQPTGGYTALAVAWITAVLIVGLSVLPGALLSVVRQLHGDGR